MVGDVRTSTGALAKQTAAYYCRAMQYLYRGTEQSPGAACMCISLCASRPSFHGPVCVCVSITHLALSLEGHAGKESTRIYEDVVAVTTPADTRGVALQFF